MKAFSVVKIVALLALTTAMIPASALHGPCDSSTPKVFEIPPAVFGGEIVTMEIDMSGVSATDQIVTIATSTPGAWSSLPSEVVVPAGSSSVTFSGQISPFYLGIATISASANGVTTSGGAVSVPLLPY